MVTGTSDRVQVPGMLNGFSTVTVGSIKFWLGF